MSSQATVFFNDPRRFGFMDLVPAGRLDAHPTLSRLGPEPLSAEFDGAALAAACRGKKVSLKVALMDQRVVAGLGNIYVSEALHLARLSPHRKASTIATPAGAPRDAAHRLAAAIKQVLEEAIERTTGEIYRASQVPRLRPRRRTVPSARLPGVNPKTDPGRPLDVLLHALSALAPGGRPAPSARLSGRPVTITTSHAGASVLPLQAMGRRG